MEQTKDLKYYSTKKIHKLILTPLKLNPTFFIVL